MCGGQQSRRCCAVSSSPPQCGHAGECCCPIGAGSWPEADSGLFSAERQWCTGFWSSQISSGPVDWSLQSECDVWLSAGRVCSRHGTPPDPSSESEPLPLISRWEPMSEEGWSPAWPPSPPVLGSLLLSVPTDQPFCDAENLWKRTHSALDWTSFKHLHNQ